MNQSNKEENEPTKLQNDKQDDIIEKKLCISSDQID